MRSITNTSNQLLKACAYVFINTNFFTTELIDFYDKQQLCFYINKRIKTLISLSKVMFLSTGYIILINRKKENLLLLPIKHSRLLNLCALGLNIIRRDNGKGVTYPLPAIYWILHLWRQEMQVFTVLFVIVACPWYGSSTKSKEFITSETIVSKCQSSINHLCQTWH